METQCDESGVIDLLVFPAFCVRNLQITRVNEAARRQFLEPGMDVLPLLQTGQEEYKAYEGGCLCLTLSLAGQPQSVTVSRVGDQDIFLADQAQEELHLQVLALAAQELRMNLSNAIISADQLDCPESDPKYQEYMGRLNRGMYQTLRLICNMSDACRYVRSSQMETRNITALLNEIFDKAQSLVEKTGIHFQYTGLHEAVYTMTDPEQLERAVLNLISNALKFTPAGGSVQAKLSKKGKVLHLTIKDSGSGIAQGIAGNLFTRYLRPPSLEDSRYGIGLGLVLVRAAAANHHGTVLLSSDEGGTRVTMTLAIRENPATLVRSNVLRMDYAGGRDHGLLELSESLPAKLYESREKN